ncbi:hypothetical protein [Desulfosporosinus youngiae]|uniref:Uncharacterized protein n=1 Tax=Desulfosporosinus youngiae DSM 17734 TaxID=768710 RepID=H5Y239_9FIRM|nr:hypothetical protein [Desulfosporosinus youngiae]EHQ88237.1 hypothetical protein DesyoDRAFT_1066 [Desulfosporosinus youngiae DSM 17734]
MQANKKACQARQCPTDTLKITLNHSIAQSAGDIPVKLDPIGIDSFAGSVRSFRLYIKARRIFIATGIIA